MHALRTTVALAATGAAALIGCSSGGGSAPPTVSRDALQEDLTTKLEDAGATANAVTCDTDLVGEIGNESRCTLDLGPTSSIVALITVTGVEGGVIDYDASPEVTQQQLEASVSALLSQTAPVDAVTCDAGLEPTVDTGTFCTVTSDGVPVQREVTVQSVKGLLMDYTVLPVLRADEVATSLTDQLESQLGARPETVECTGDLQGRVDATVDCTVTLGASTQDFVLTVESVDGTQVNYGFKPKT
ncbi:DUF4333 domain-containing protein [Mycolicibacterium sp. F2034L]|uniref:DUF4333 domain-containing protein n=1 Tax=Mycolicibacterium sp. F2034L TaxID=2926422 RepID=UPI001FF19796|nr:DUF4333 domain-containing protein [Mycolicibacterium sp. F2034L]MCK0173401.1 DUF4333 domain-containing protein [Mycolicibacterium sp. F2034L]